MMKKTGSFIFFLMLTICGSLFLHGEARANPSELEYEGTSVIWKVGDTRIWRFPVQFEEEVAALSDRFNAFYSKGFKIEDIKATKAAGYWELRIGKERLFTPKPEHAGVIKLNPQAISLFCLSRVYEAVGDLSAHDLTSVHKLRGSYSVSGTVSWYGGSNMYGRKFANGERFEEGHLIAAAKSLPFGTLVRITTPKTGKSVVVRITDRFREHRNRVLDISKSAAEILGIKSMGIAKVNVQVIGRVSKIGGN